MKVEKNHSRSKTLDFPLDERHTTSSRPHQNRNEKAENHGLLRQYQLALVRKIIIVQMILIEKQGCQSADMLKDLYDA